MNNFLEENTEDRFAKGQSRRNLRVISNAETKTQFSVGDLRKLLDSNPNDRLEALRVDSDETRRRRIELPGAHEREFGTSGRRPSRRRMTSFEIDKARR